MEVGSLAEQEQRGREQAHGRLLTGGEQVRGDAHDVDDLGCTPVGERRRREPGEHVVARALAPVLDVGRELFGEELQRAVRERLVAGAAQRAGAPATDGVAEPFVIGFGHSEEVGDHEHGEGLGELADELARAVPDELVQLAVGQPPHELLVLLQPLRGDQPHEQPAVRRVHGRVERGELVAHRQLVAVLLDERADVVAFERHREPRERPGHRRARREGGSVVVHGNRFVVPGHHEDVVMRFARDRALRAQRLEVGIRVGDERRVPKEVDRVEVAHRISS